MKKAIISIAIVIVLLVGALLAIPIFFKKNLLEVAKNTLNNQLNAKVEFGDIKLSLFRNFPQATLEFEDVTVKGKGEFQNDTLLSVAYVSTKMDLSSLFRKSERSIEEIILEKPQLKLIVSKSGKANWDVAPEQQATSKMSESTGSGSDEFQLQLANIEIRNADLIYDDKLAQMIVELTDVNFDISGNMYGNSTQLKTKGKAKDFSFKYGDVSYISNTSLDISTLLDVDFERMKFTIAENELFVNRLPLELSGSFEMPTDTTFVDLQLKTKESDFENFLALVPPVYEPYLKDIKTSGSATISGNISGFYFDENYPKFTFKVQIADGRFQYADMPEDINHIQANVLLAKPQGDLDLIVITVNEAHAEIKNNPVDLSLKVKTPVSDPYFDGVLVGKINLNHLKDALPLDSVNLSGIIDANLFAKGKYSDIEAEAYDKIKSDGVVLLNNFRYESPDFTQPIIVSDGKLDFSPESIDLRKFNVIVGQSNFQLFGKVSNYMNYFLKDGLLTGNLQLNSSQINLNELLRLQVISESGRVVTPVAKTSGSGAEVDDEVLAFDIPANIDISFNSNIQNAVFDKLLISNIKGSIRAVDEKLLLNNLNMNMLDGELKMNGSYKNSAQNQPMFDFNFDIVSVDIPSMYNTVSGVKSIMPAAGNSTGKLSSQLGMKGRLSPQLKLIPSSANGTGTLSTKDLEIKDSPVFNQLGGILKKEKLKEVGIDDFIAHFTVENGNLILKPFTTKVIGQETKVEGSLNAESLLNMRMDFNVEREMFGPDIQNVLAIIPGNKKITKLPAGVVISGLVGDPKVSMDLSATKKAVADATKDDIKKSLDQLGKGLQKFFK
jgi:hypothetical protein